MIKYSFWVLDEKSLQIQMAAILATDLLVS